MFGWIRRLERQSRVLIVLATLLIVAGIGFVDYITGWELSFSVFYLLALGLATWFVGRGFAWFLSVLSVAVSLAGDLAAGERYSGRLVPWWNAAIVLVFYLVVVWLLARLRALYGELEERVRRRTAALTEEMAERKRLEQEILQISEREQRRIGHDLHDSLCQHFTATAMAGQVLTGRLEAKALPEAADAGKIVEMVEEGIDLARNLARGLHPVEMEAEGLMSAFQELADTITKGARILCVFECSSPVLIHDDAAATHLYRIAQEAVRNALRHGKAKRIDINLAERDGLMKLTVEDNGIGLPEGGPADNGLGIRIMAHRAAMIGGIVSIEPAPTGGTMVTCRFPTGAASSSKPHDKQDS
jgi:signal transduction histidine kinase